MTISSPDSQRRDRLLFACLGIFLICYIASVARRAAQTPLWADEILSVWVSRLPSITQIYSAVARGSEFSPPTYPLLLHYWAKIAGYGLLALRIPSIAASLIAASCTFVLLRRYVGAARAAFAICLMLEEMRYYTLQSRQYVFVTALFAIVLVLWDGFNRRPVWWRNVLIAVLLALAISFHFYAVLLVPCLALFELIYMWSTRTVRISMWLTFVAAGASILVWSPLMHAIRSFNAGDINSAGYYGKPNIRALIQAYKGLFLPDQWSMLLVLVAVIIIAAGQFFRYGDLPEQDNEEDRREPAFWAIVVGLVLYPVTVFIFAKLISKSYNDRYAVASVIGLSAALAGSFRSTLSFRRFAPLFVLAASALTLGHSFHNAVRENWDFLADLPGSCPIVIGDGHQWFPIMEETPTAIRSRIAYVTLPPGVAMSDPTYEHQIERLKTIFPNLWVEDVTRFLAEHPTFYLVDWMTSDDTQVSYLKQMHRVTLVDCHPREGATCALIYKSTAPTTNGNGALASLRTRRLFTLAPFTRTPS